MLGCRILFLIPVSLYLLVVNFFINFLYFFYSFNSQLPFRAGLHLFSSQNAYILYPVMVSLIIAFKYQKSFPKGGR